MIDLLVVGGGPAGLVTGLHAARAGLDVVVADRRQGPIDKACGEGLMPHTVAQLEKFGIPLRGRPFHGITYLDETHRVDAGFRAGVGMGVRRTALHAALLEAATAAGVRLVHNDIGPVTQDGTSVRCGEFRARYLAAADGLHSPIRRSLGLGRPSRGVRRWGIRRHYATAPWSDRVEVYWAPGAEAYVTPVADDCVGVAILTSTQGGFDRHLTEFPLLAAHLAGQPHGTDRAAGPLRQPVSSRTADRVLLVGDAAGYVDALTGEGLGIAFAGAELLVNCVVSDNTQDYDRQWRKMSRRYRLLTAALLEASGFEPVRSRLVPAAAALPAVFAGMVNLLAS
ncbi:MAG TPA: NAD(P)/FAD-dependent oxidoreductase [Mycobacterium sp.]|nr:NAD(P)/FAD-dependent oxidoreductase [Mycobacterium sp.]